MHIPAPGLFNRLSCILCGGVVTERKALGACESRFRQRFKDENLHASIEDQGDFLGVLKND